MLLHTYFSIAGHCVITCSTQEEALQVFAVVQDVPDLIFVAIEHRKEAYKLIDFMKERAIYASVRIVAMVLAAEQPSVQKALSNTTVSYLVKPFQIQDVLALVSPVAACSSSA